MALSDKTNEELRELLVGARQREHPLAAKLAEEIVQLLTARGASAVPKHTSAPRRRPNGSRRWTSADVAEWIAPFAGVARTVPGSRRKAEVSGGGFKKAGQVVVDHYAGIKTDRLNAILVCYMADWDGDPEFMLFCSLVPGKAPSIPNDSLAARRAAAQRVYRLEDLPAALAEWKALAARA